MSNLFSTSNLVPVWNKATEILKGAEPGHPFNGNQYTSASGELHDRALQTLKDVRSGNYLDPWSEHKKIAEGHREVAMAIETGMKSGKIPRSKWGEAQKAIDAHNRAADKHISAHSGSAFAAMQAIAPYTENYEEQKDYCAKNARGRSEGASYASKIADEMTKRIGDVLKSVSEISKGAQVGHPFEGNQWETATIGAKAKEVANGAKALAYRAKTVGGWGLSPLHKSLANKHAELAMAHSAMAEDLWKQSQRAERDGKLSLASKLNKLALAHRYAASDHENATTSHHYAAMSPSDSGTNVAIMLSKNAQESTQKALDLGNSYGDFTKGARAGHPFEGNQWTGRGKPPIGSRVRVGDGAGVSSGKTGTVINPREIKTNERGIPDVGAGHYKPVDWNRQVAIRYDNGDLDTMYHQYLNPA